jgi:hypothetical protein
MARMVVRRSGTLSHPWEARCRECSDEKTHLTAFGAIAVNTRGIGNRLWVLAMYGTYIHTRWHDGIREGGA